MEHDLLARSIALENSRDERKWDVPHKNRVSFIRYTEVIVNRSRDVVMAIEGKTV